MELKLVYRFLRKISDWAIAGYYSDIHVQGYENVPKDGPVIIASTHHNELIDIATLAATIPHRRHVSFWAKSTSFDIPVISQILSSSGAIPVKRNPDRAGPNNGSSSNSDLFNSTSVALAQGQVVGIFPEGTSYTQPSIVQVMSGAARAAVEFAKYQREDQHQVNKDVVLVPAAIVYTDKSHFQSRLVVRYGKAISMSSYRTELFDTDNIDQASRDVVKNITAEIESRLFEMTVNAKDWETYYTAKTARQILWKDDDNVRLQDWVPVSQKLVEVFSATDDTVARAKASVAKYFSLLHYTGLTHDSLEYLIPSTAYSASRIALLSTLLTPSFRTIITFPKSLAQTLLFIPPFLLHLPGYIFGQAIFKLLATPGEEEGEAQFKAIGSGIGLGLYFSIFGRTILRWINGILKSDNTLVRTLSILEYEKVEPYLNRVLGATGTRHMYQAVSLLIQPKINAVMSGWMGRALSVIGFGWLVVKWHGLLVKSNHKRYKRLLAGVYLFSGLVQPRSYGLTMVEADAKGYTRLPPPPTNAFIKRKDAEEDVTTIQAAPPPRAATRKLISLLLAQRQEATIEMRKVLQQELEKNGKLDIEWLKRRNATVLAVG